MKQASVKTGHIANQTEASHLFPSKLINLSMTLALLRTSWGVAWLPIYT